MMAVIVPAEAEAIVKTVEQSFGAAPAEVAHNMRTNVPARARIIIIVMTPERQKRRTRRCKTAGF